MDKLPTEKQMNSGWFQWLVKTTPSCQKASELASIALENPLSLRQRLLLRLHYLICVWCKRYAFQMRFLQRAMRQYGRQVETDALKLSAEQRQRLKHALQKPF